MRYVSTRGSAPPQSFSEMLLAGLAPDGGLYMPQAWPYVATDFAKLPYGETARAVIGALARGSFSDEDLAADIEAAYAGFDDARIAPLCEIAPGLFILELFHGPTLAFKDIALQVLGRLFARALAERGGRATVLVATSGDTGSAAIAALGDLPNIDVVVLHPHGRVSEVQRRQMTGAPYKNVHNLALKGTFDDCQNIVKALFAERDFAARVSLTAVNSINFARIAAQAVYYFTATAALGRPATFVVPSGNFGDVFAGECAMRMGLPIEKLVVATNSNDILARALNDGIYASGIARPTLSPSMDIQVASNFERALYEASQRDAKWVSGAMAQFAQTRALELPPAIRTALAARYDAFRADDAQTIATIRRVWNDTGLVIDPHTAVAMAAAYNLYGRSEGPLVVLSTAHPAKFPAAIEAALGRISEPPPSLSKLLAAPEKMTVMEPDKGLVRGFIEARLPPL